jgi:hypothetical protein
LAKLYTPPEDELDKAPVPEVPAACVAAVTPALVQLKTVFVGLVLKPVGKLAVPLDPMLLKSLVTGVPAVVIDCWA